MTSGAPSALFSTLGLPTIDGYAAAIGPGELTRAASRLGLPFVARAPYGSTGDGTYLVRSPDRPLPAAATTWLLERYIHGYSLNATAVTTDRVTFTLPPSVQIIGQ